MTNIYKEKKIVSVGVLSLFLSDIDDKTDVSNVFIIIFHYVQGFAWFSNFSNKVCLQLQMYSKKVAMEINVIVQECEMTVQKKIALKLGFMVSTGSERVERNQISWF